MTLDEHRTQDRDIEESCQLLTDPDPVISEYAARHLMAVWCRSPVPSFRRRAETVLCAHFGVTMFADPPDVIDRPDKLDHARYNVSFEAGIFESVLASSKMKPFWRSLANSLTKMPEGECELSRWSWFFWNPPTT
jgi:hypothetical protein